MVWVAPRTWLAGEKLTAAKLNELRDALKAIGDPWTDYTPAWQASGTAPVLGNGQLTGDYVLAGKWCTGRLRLTMGSTTTYGTGVWNLTLPFALASGAQWEALGTCSIRDASPSAGYALGAISASSTVISAETDSGARLGPTVPITFANGDILSIDFQYEVA